MQGLNNMKNYHGIGSALINFFCCCCKKNSKKLSLIERLADQLPESDIEKVIEKILDSKKDADESNKIIDIKYHGEPSSHHMMNKQDFSVLKALLERGADLESKDAIKWLLSISKTLKSLLDSRNSSDQNTLHIADFKGNKDIFTLLLKAEATPQIKSNCLGESLLGTSAKARDADTISEVINFIDRVSKISQVSKEWMHLKIEDLSSILVEAKSPEDMRNPFEPITRCTSHKEINSLENLDPETYVTFKPMGAEKSFHPDEFD
jgi:ankyrin repeat protein